MRRGGKMRLGRDIRKVDCRSAVLEQEKDRAIDLPQFEKLTGFDKLYSIRHPESRKNVRVFIRLKMTP